MDNFNFKKYLKEGKLHLNENIEQYIDSEDDISDIRGGKTMAINFNRRMNGGQRKEAVEAYVYDKYGNDVELDWRDGQEVEIHIGNASNDPLPSNNLGVSDLNKYVEWKKKNFSSIHSPVSSPLREGKELDEGKLLKEEEYPNSAPRVYVVMLGNKGGPVGPYRVYADKSTAEAEAAQQKENSKQLGSDIRAFVQDLAYIK